MAKFCPFSSYSDLVKNPENLNMTKNGLKMIQNCLKLKSYYANDPWGAKNHLMNFFSYEVKNLSLLSKPKWKLPKNLNFAKKFKKFIKSDLLVLGNMFHLHKFYYYLCTPRMYATFFSLRVNNFQNSWLIYYPYNG